MRNSNVSPRDGVRWEGVGSVELRRELKKLRDPKKAKVYQWFFKTGPGEYGEGDRFLGVTVPKLRKLAMRYVHVPRRVIGELLKGSFHEERLLALFILTYQFPDASPARQKEIYNFYLKNTRWINNWDLVDCSASRIVGVYLIDKDRAILDRLVRSGSLWERRIAIIATLAFIVRGESKDTLRLAARLLQDREDLIHKAVGWMLREVGKRCSTAVLENFLKTNSSRMPRTMLRYAIERFPQEKRKTYLKGDAR